MEQVFRIALDDVAALQVLGDADADRMQPSRARMSGVRAWRPGDPYGAMHRVKTDLMSHATGERYVCVAPRIQRPRTYILADIGPRTAISYASVTKRSIISQIALLLGRCAIYSGSEVKGLAQSGKTLSHTSSIYTEDQWIAGFTILAESVQTAAGKTNIVEALGRIESELSGVRSLVITISDFMMPPPEWEKALESIGFVHSTVAIKVRAPLDEGLPYGEYGLVGAEVGNPLSAVGGTTGILPDIDRTLDSLEASGLISLCALNLKTHQGRFRDTLADFFAERNRRIEHR